MKKEIEIKIEKAIRETLVINNKQSIKYAIKRILRINSFTPEQSSENHKTSNSSLDRVTHCLSDSDQWFDANLRCLLEGEVALVKMGKKEKINRKKLAEWIMKHV